MSNPRVSVLSLAIVLATCGPTHAQTPRDELLALVPGDTGFCLAVQDLRGQYDRWSRSPWVKALAESPPGQTVLGAPEIQNLVRVHDELKKRLELDWPTLRDDVLGDAVVFAFRPAVPGNPDHEQGMLLIRPRKNEIVPRFLERLNKEQEKSGELKSVTQLEHRGVKYQKRVDQRSTHFVLIDTNLVVFSGNESLIRGVIDQRASAKADQRTPLQQHIARAGADRAVATLWINPRAFEAELEQKAQMNNGPDAVMLRTFLAYWRPLDSIVLSVTDAEQLDVKLAVQARVKDLPPSLRRIFNGPVQASELWARFPTSAIVTFADRIDMSTLPESLADFSTPETRKAVLDTLQKGAKAAFNLDLMKDVLPNLGPDWGVCIAAAEKPGQFPHVLAALAARPGSRDVDKALVKAVELFAQLALLDHNFKNANAQLQLRSAKQGDVDVRFVTGDALPTGLQPAWALKDGYLVFASAPDAILRFRTPNGPAANQADTPILRVSIAELARFVRDHRDLVVEHIADKNQLKKVVAEQRLDTALAVCDLIDHITLLQTSGNGQLTWTMRVRTKNP